MHVRGPAGNLEARYDPAPSPEGTQAVLCHPHPRYGGSMHDAVLDRLAGVLLDAGVGVLRFNFRGVGGSAGAYDGGPGEVQDLLAAAGWLLEAHPGEALWAGGYSFGAWVVWQALEAGLEAERVLLVAPPVGPMAFPAIGRSVPTDVVIGTDDDFADPRALDTWQPVTVDTIEGADHFFTDHLDALEARLRAIVVGG